MTPKTSPSTEGESGESRTERLHKVMARAGVASRRECEWMIAAGRVAVNGKVVTEPGTTVDPAVDIVEVDGRILQTDRPRRYFLMSKPAGYLTTVADPFGRKTVMQLLEGAEPGLFPVGRLDRDTTGLLLLTDDGELANRLIHPRYHVPKTYVALVEGVPNDAALRMLAQGVELDDGPTAPAEIGSILPSGARTSVEITVREGRKRQIRRMFEAVGHPVHELRRTRFGPLSDESLADGDVRELTTEEVERLQHATEPEP